MKSPSEIDGGAGASRAGLDLNKAAAAWVEEHGDCLYRYALARVRKPEVAEDLVWLLHGLGLDDMTSA